MLPPTDAPVRTQVRAHGEWFGFQEFMIREGAEGPIEGAEVAGAATASPAPEAIDAIATASRSSSGPPTR